MGMVYIKELLLLFIKEHLSLRMTQKISDSSAWNGVFFETLNHLLRPSIEYNSQNPPSVQRDSS